MRRNQLLLESAYFEVGVKVDKSSRKQFVNVLEIAIHVISDPEILLLRIYPKDIYSYLHVKVSMYKRSPGNIVYK